MSNKFRKEVTVTLDGVDLACRPTLAKIGEIEGRFGPALELLRRIGSGNIGIVDITAMMQVIVKGVPGAPPPKDVPELVFQAGAFSLAPQVSEYLANALTSDEPQSEEKAGN